MTRAPVTARRVDWLINDFVRRLPGVAYALLASSDGLTLTASEQVDEIRADQLAAVTSGLASLTGGAARCLGAEPVNQTIVEMAGGYLFVTAVGDGSVLAVFVEPRCDIGVIGYEMALLVDRVAQLRTPSMRSDPDAGRGNLMSDDQGGRSAAVPSAR